MFKQLSRPMRVCALSSFLIVPALFIAGIIFLKQSGTNSRSGNLDTYNSVVGAWTASEMKDFTSSRFELFIPALGDIPIVNSPNSSRSTLNEAPGSSIFTYSPWVAVFENHVPVAQDGHYEIFTYDYLGQNYTIHLGIEPSKPMTLTKAEIGCRSTTDCDAYDQASSSYTTCIAKPLCMAECQKLGGGFNSVLGICNYQVTLTSICVRLKQTTIGWQNDRERGATSYAGCYFENNFEMGVYTPTKQVPLGAKLQKFEVRSNKDPLITASRLSMGTYNMGEDKTTVLTLGIALVTLGAIVAVSTMSTVAMCIRLATRQRLRRPGGPPAPNTDGKLEGSTSRGVSLTPGRPPGVVGSQTLATSPSGNLSTSVAQPVSNRGHGYSPSMKSLNISLPAPLASETDAFHTTSSKLYPSAKDHLEPFQASRNKGSTKSLLPPYESNKDLLDP